MYARGGGGPYERVAQAKIVSGLIVDLQRLVVEFVDGCAAAVREARREQRERFAPRVDDPTGKTQRVTNGRGADAGGGRAGELDERARATRGERAGCSARREMCLREASARFGCTSTALPTCTGPAQPCFRDPLCALGGLGCGAGGRRICRYCGFVPFFPCPVP